MVESFKYNKQNYKQYNYSSSNNNLDDGEGEGELNTINKNRINKMNLEIDNRNYFNSRRNQQSERNFSSEPDEYDSEEISPTKLQKEKNKKILELNLNEMMAKKAVHQRKTTLRQKEHFKHIKRSGSIEKQFSLSDVSHKDAEEDTQEHNIRQTIDKIFTFTKRRYFDAIISILSSVSFFIYVILTYFPEKLIILDYFDYLVCIAYVFEYIIYVLLAQHKVQHILSLKSILDILSITPLILISFQESNITSISHSFVTGFINITRILRVLRVFKIFYIIKTEENDITKQIFMIISTILMILFIFSGLLQVVENEEVNERLEYTYSPFNVDILQMRTKFHHYIYFTIITITTVGFGDIVTYTALGKALVIFLVLITIALIPKQTNELIQLIGAQSEYARNNYKSSADIKHLVITGDITVDSLESFSLELFHPDHGTQYKHAIIINPREPTKEIEALMSMKSYEHFIHYLEGNPMNDRDLLRGDIIKAKACVIFNNKNSADPNSSDHRNILLALYVKKFVYNNSENTNGFCNFRLSLQLIKPENKYHYYNSLQNIYKKRMPADNLIIIEEIKMNLLAKSCLTPGIMAMISNLVMSSGNIPNNDKDWLKEYSEGRGHEIYRISLSDSYKYLTFLEIVKEIYSKEQAIAFAIEIEVNKVSIVKLNPGNISIDTIISNYDKDDIKININNVKLHVYIICSDKSIAEKVCIMEPDKKQQIKNSLYINNSINKEKSSYINSENDSFDNNNKDFHTINKRFNPNPGVKFNEEVKYLNSNFNSNVKVNNLVEKDTFTNNNYEFNKLNVGLDRNNNNKKSSNSLNKTNMNKDLLNTAMISSNYAPHLSLSYNLNNEYDSFSDSQESDLEEDNNNLKKNYVDYEIDLEEYFTMKNFDFLLNNKNADIMQHTIKDSKEITNHILVCGIHPNLFHFILPLRAKYLGEQNLKYIVILGENLSESLYNSFAKFPFIIYIQGSPLLPENLYRANIMNAEIAVILSNSNIKTDIEESNDNQTLDAETIFIYKAIKKCNKNIQIMTELVSANNIEYLLHKATPNFQSDNPENPESNFNNYEYSPLFASGEVFTPSIIDRITCQIYYNPNILTILEQILNGGATNKNKKIIKLEKELKIPSSNMYLLQMPEAFVSETFEKLFNHLIDSNYVIPLGLYRRSVNENFYFVYTNPSKSILLRQTDLVFVLGQTNNILDLLEDKEISIVEEKKEENNLDKQTTSESDSSSEKLRSQEKQNHALKRQSVFKRKASKIYGKSVIPDISKSSLENTTATTNFGHLNHFEEIKRTNIKKQSTIANKFLGKNSFSQSPEQKIITGNTNAVNPNSQRLPKNSIISEVTIKNNIQAMAEKMSSKYQEINKIKDNLTDIKHNIDGMKKGYDSFINYLNNIIESEIQSELNIYLENK